MNVFRFGKVGDPLRGGQEGGHQDCQQGEAQRERPPEGKPQSILVHPDPDPDPNLFLGSGSSQCFRYYRKIISTKNCQSSKI